MKSGDSDSLIIVVCTHRASVYANVHSLAKVVMEGEKPVCICEKMHSACGDRVVFPAMGALTWWYTPSDAQSSLESNSEQVP